MPAVCGLKFSLTCDTLPQAITGRFLPDNVTFPLKAKNMSATCPSILPLFCCVVLSLAITGCGHTVVKQGASPSMSSTAPHRPAIGEFRESLIGTWHGDVVCQNEEHRTIDLVYAMTFSPDNAWFVQTPDHTGKGVWILSASGDRMNITIRPFGYPWTQDLLFEGELRENALILTYRTGYRASCQWQLFRTLAEDK